MLSSSHNHSFVNMDVYTTKTSQVYFIKRAMLRANFPKAEAIKWNSMNGFISLTRNSRMGIVLHKFFSDIK